jgi:hypothetical protein
LKLTKFIVNEGKRLKEIGNDFFKTGDLQKALQNYNKVFLFVNGLVGKENELA